METEIVFILDTERRTQRTWKCSSTSKQGKSIYQAEALQTAVALDEPISHGTWETIFRCNFGRHMHDFRTQVCLPCENPKFRVINPSKCKALYPDWLSRLPL